MTDEKMSTEGTDEIQNPRDEFQQERYEKQQQKAPGLQSGMKPVPDSGEQSYHAATGSADEKPWSQGETRE